MSQHLQGRLIDYWLDGITSLSGRFRLFGDKSSVPAEDLVHGGLPRVILLERGAGTVQLGEGHRNVLYNVANPGPGNRGVIIIGQPGVAGRRVRIVTRDAITSSSAYWLVAISDTPGAANNRISGTLMRGGALTGTGTPPIQINGVDVADQMVVGFRGSASSPVQATRGDWLEFLDMETFWAVSGMAARGNNPANQRPFYVGTSLP